MVKLARKPQYLQAQLLSRTRLPPLEDGDRVLHTPLERGCLLCSSRPLGEGLPGFQRLPSAATSLCPARGQAPPPPPGVRSPLPPRVPACGEPALLPPPCEPAMHGGSQSAVKVASLLGRGEGGRHQLPVTLGKSLPLFCPQPPCLQDGETRAERSGGAAWGAHFPAGFVRKCPHGVRGWGSVLLVGGCTRGCGPGSHLLLHPASVCFWCPAWLCC